VYPSSIDEIVRQSGFAPQKASELLLLLELKGVIESLPGKSYQKNSTLAS
jgi:predicted Rossmann fold nucleotide-binding protein DprA/Smf involved in DNA uptake